MVKFSLYQFIAIRRVFFRFVLKFHSRHRTPLCVGLLCDTHKTSIVAHEPTVFFSSWIKCFMKFYSNKSSFSWEFNETAKKVHWRKYIRITTFAFFFFQIHSRECWTLRSAHTWNRICFKPHSAHCQAEKWVPIPMDACGFVASLWPMFYDCRRAHSFELNLFCGFSDCTTFHSNSEMAGCDQGRTEDSNFEIFEHVFSILSIWSSRLKAS